MPYGSMSLGGGGQGSPGVTPHIGSNGNWYIGGTDTGVDASGGTLAITAKAVGDALNNGVAPSNTAIAGLGAGWWYVPASDATITGKPPNYSGDLIVFKQLVSNPAGRNRGVMFVYGQHADHSEAMWIRYKINNKWDKWIHFDADTATAILPSNVATRIAELEAWRAKQIASETALKKNVATLSTRLQAAAAEADSNKKVLTAIQQQLQATPLLSIDTIKTELAKAGWGPRAPLSPGQPGQAGADTALPRVYANFGENIPTTLSQKGMQTSTTGVVQLQRSNSDRHRIFVLVVNDANQADRVTGISIDGGMSGVWPDRDAVIGGQKFKMYYSTGAYTDTSASIRVHFN